jgi:hypothetical protein
MWFTANNGLLEWCVRCLVAHSTAGSCCVGDFPFFLVRSGVDGCGCQHSTLQVKCADVEGGMCGIRLSMQTPQSGVTAVTPPDGVCMACR